uniref:Uncharacterized protein n=1 Tax=Rhizophora mucronata TaxID=61149 RepID=A0A2P2PXZ6_RHIMU
MQASDHTIKTFVVNSRLAGNFKLLFWLYVK